MSSPESVSSGSKRHKTVQLRATLEEVETLNPLPRLPSVVLRIIFRYGVEMEGSKFIQRVSCVCHEWNRLTLEPSLTSSLRKLDLSVYEEADDEAAKSATVSNYLTDEDLEAEILARNWPNCLHVSLSGQKMITGPLISRLLQKMPRLISVDLSGSSPTPELLGELPDLCPSLERVSLCGLATAKVFRSLAPIENLVRVFGCQLVALRLSYLPVLNSPSRMETLVKIISKECPLLEELDLRRRPTPYEFMTKTFNVRIGEFQNGCRNLKELRLDGHNPLFARPRHFHEIYNREGFSKLRTYSHTCIKHTGVTRSDNRYWEDRNGPLFYHIVSWTKTLTELDISSTNFRPQSVYNLELPALKKLYLADMRWEGDKDGEELMHCCAFWMRSVRRLDLSSNRRKWMEFLRLGEGQNSDPYSRVQQNRFPDLRYLDLSDSFAKKDTVKYFLNSCTNLKSVDLSKCPYLPRKLQRVFTKEGLPDLLKSL